MLKNLKRSDIQVTPFVATKPWVITNFQNQDLLLWESGSLTNNFISQEFIDYQTGNDLPILNRECNIALEQQNNDVILYEEGEKITGTFSEETDPKNNTGTYKRLVYTTTKNCFYNDYNDPTKMFGMEHIDFPLSNTKKILSDKFRSFNVPKSCFGEKMLENSILLVDNSLDDNFVITDDGDGNIVIKDNVFCKSQEVRPILNSIDYYKSSSFCDYYYVSVESRQNVSASYLNTSSVCMPW